MYKDLSLYLLLFPLRMSGSSNTPITIEHTLHTNPDFQITFSTNRNQDLEEWLISGQERYKVSLGYPALPESNKIFKE